MVTILGFEINLPAGLEFFSILWVNMIVNIIAWTAATIIINFILLRIIRFITRQLPGDLEDIVFAILRGPLILLILLYGGVQTLFLVNLTPAAKHYVNLVTITIVVIIITHILGRVIKDILVYYGNKWALKTESKVDDVLIPVLNLFGPVVLVLSAALIILPLWGFNITSVLVGAGVIGLVLGLALQSTLANIFSGLSLLVEAPFRTGDLITLADGRICEVQRVGMRSTQLYSVKEHATVFVPNTTFSTTTLTNITKPTVDQKFSLEFKAPANIPLETFMEDVRKIALAHPATLASDMNGKVGLLKSMLVESREMQVRSNQITPRNLKEEGRVEQVIPKLELEGSLNANSYTIGGSTAESDPGNNRQGIQRIDRN